MPVPFPFARPNALQPAVTHSHSSHTFPHLCSWNSSQRAKWRSAPTPATLREQRWICWKFIWGRENMLDACFTGSKKFLTTLRRNVAWGIQLALKLQWKWEVWTFYVSYPGVKCWSMVFLLSTPSLNTISHVGAWEVDYFLEIFWETVDAYLSFLEYPQRQWRNYSVVE